MDEKKNLLCQIESMRKKMIHSSSNQPLHSKEVIEASKELDHLLNQYTLFMEKNK